MVPIPTQKHTLQPIPETAPQTSTEEHSESLTDQQNANMGELTTTVPESGGSSAA